MKQSRLDELMKKEEINNQELMEVMGAMFLSMSKHLNELKTQVTDLNNRMAFIEENIRQTIQNIPVFNIISDMEEDEPDD